MIGLDLETSPRGDHPQPYALQPWRAMEGTAGIDSCGVARSTGAAKCVKGHYPQLRDVLAELRGQTVVTWNGLFDVAWLIASGLEEHVAQVNWLDAMLIWKWVDNSQQTNERPAWSLADGAQRWLDDWPHLGKFLAMKDLEVVAGEDDAYWELRGKMDALVTVMIAERAWEVLTPQQQRSVKIEALTLIPHARSWVNGIPMDAPAAAQMAPAVTREMEAIEVKLGVQNSDAEWVPSKILRSPKQMCDLLYTTWGLPCTRFSEITGGQSADKAALTYLADADPRCLEILRWRELNTQYTKFITGIGTATEYCQSNVVHPAPRIFSTYTGRMTYNSKSGRKGDAAKAKIGVPLHQWPRNKQLRRLIVT